MNMTRYGPVGKFAWNKLKVSKAPWHFATGPYRFLFTASTINIHQPVTYSSLKAKASTVEALAWTFEAKAIGHEAFKHCRYSRN